MGLNNTRDSILIARGSPKSIPSRHEHGHGHGRAFRGASRFLLQYLHPDFAAIDAGILFRCKTESARGRADQRNIYPAIRTCNNSEYFTVCAVRQSVYTVRLCSTPTPSALSSLVDFHRKIFYADARDDVLLSCASFSINRPSNGLKEKTIC